ncbi:N-6 DNA methylase [Candidatus Woesearchaeota archaeon]|nr:N-6 DNA methylase [Candidatus Woesearchaeota archaeon]
MDKDKAKLALKHLIDRYNSNKHLKDFISNEKQISRSLIEPFVRDVLGWDIEDPQEFKVEVPASGKRVDILVCLNGVTKFIVEAKSLTQDIVDYNDFYKQTISYAHSKEKTFAILTNFRHFIILRCDVEVDNPLKAAVKIINIENFTDDDFDLLYNFSKEIWVEKGEENPLYLKLANFKRRAKVDVELLENLKEWRQSIINNIKKHPRQNKYDFSDEKSKYEVEEEIQRFLDRIIFICYAEDKGFVDSELKSLIELKKDKHYESQSWLLDKIRSIFKKYWNDYNSDLFKLGKCDEFFIEDAVLLKILTDLRKPKDKLSYDFASIEADILGKTYENFIGHVIAGEKRFKEKESKGKRKSEGIYYTPAYIVDYIVRNTVKEYIKGKSFASINKVKILDPACGSGSFLIKAFDALAEESKNILKRELNYEEKKNLMLNCIHGVDKDERAVDICKLNLSLKLAERGQKLPELHNNIKCGDSLIDDENIAGYKAFKWEEEFKEVMQNGGFDVVIGNPPYFKIFEDNPINKTIHYLEIKSGMMNSAAVFINRGFKLLKNDGYFGMIVPKMLAFTDSWDKLRVKLLNNCKIQKIVDCRKAFEHVLLEQIIFTFINTGQNIKNNIVYIGNIKNNFIEETARLPQNLLIKENTLFLEPEPKAYKIKEKMEESGIRLGHVSDIILGLGIQSMPSFKEDYKTGYEKSLRGDDIQRYFIRGCKFYDKNDKKLSQFQKEIQKIKSSPHIVAQRIVAHIKDHIKITATYDEEGLFSFNTVTNIYVKEYSIDIKLILALLNSKPIQYFTYKFIYSNAIRSMDFYKAYAQKIPIPKRNTKLEIEVIKLADKMLSLNKKLQEIGDKNTLEKQKIQEEIRKTDSEIDELVYQLYGITEEERKIIEDSLR